MKRGIYYVMFCLVGLTAFSCNKQLEIEPIDQIPDARFWSSERDIDGAVAGGYALLRKTLSESPKVASPASDVNIGFHPRHYMYGDRRGLIFTSVNQDPLRNTLDADLKVNRIRSILGGVRQWDEILFNWASFYQIVEQCNLVIENAERVKDNQFITYSRAMYVAEARFLRAFTYFYMVRIWGDVPLNTKSRTTEKLGRTEMNAVLDFVESELKAAETDLRADYSGSGRNAFRATKGTVHATLAHVLAWRHKDAEAVAYATKVIDGGVYRLLKVTSDAEMAAYVNIWKGKSPEGIFEIEFDAASGEYGMNGSLANMTLFGGVFSNRQQPYWALNLPKLDTNTVDTYPNNRVDDPRAFFPDTTKDLRYVANFAKPVSFTKGFNYVFRKYGFPVDPNQNLFDANIVIFRMADIILLRAECNARLLSYGPARADLNTIRGRAGLGAWTGADADLYFEIFKERTRELLGEGHYFYDLVRTGFITRPIFKLGDTYKLPRPDMTQAEFDEGAWTWPVSNRAFTDNPNIQQLRYWQRY